MTTQTKTSQVMINGLTPYYSDSDGAIYNMDCLEAMKHMPDKSVDLVLTDPPYAMAGMNYDIC